MKAPWVSASSKINISFQQQPPRLVRWGFHPSPLGKFFVGINEDDAVCLLVFAQNEKGKAKLSTWQKKWPATDFKQDNAATKKIMDAVFVAPKPLKVSMFGTDFQKAVWKSIAAIPAGKTSTYAKLAEKVKNPKAVRAVGTACGANPVPVIVPCHRVLGSNGSFGGFGGGLPLKRKMLATEGAI